MKVRKRFVVGAALGAAAGVVWVRRRSSNRRHHADVTAGEAATGEPRHRVVVLGAGFGGLTAAETLAAGEHEGLQVTLVDRHNYHLFTPLIYQVSAGLINPMHIVYPARAIAADRHFRFRESIVQSIDLEGRRVITDEEVIPYDELILALGAASNFFGVPGAEEHALPLKTMGDSVAVRNRVIDVFEAADVESDPERRHELLTFMIVGGGATGVELAGGLDGLIRYVLLKHYPLLHAEEITIVLIEASGGLLHGWDPFMVDLSRSVLEEKGILIRTSTKVVRVTPEFVELKDGERIRARTVIWTAGVRPPKVVADLSVPKVKGGRLQVNQYLELPEYPGVFAVGDIAGFPDPKTGQPVPGLAATAEQQGHAVAENILRRLSGRPMRPYHYHLVGQTLSLGRNEAAVDVAGVKLKGFIAWIVWRAIHLVKLRGWRNRIGVLMDWAFSYIFLRDTLRLESEPDRPSTVETAAASPR
jgi:NADH:ubiquinone reductase (H+-translocating)